MERFRKEEHEDLYWYDNLLLAPIVLVRYHRDSYLDKHNLTVTRADKQQVEALSKGIKGFPIIYPDEMKVIELNEQAPDSNPFFVQLPLFPQSKKRKYATWFIATNADGLNFLKAQDYDQQLLTFGVRLIDENGDVIKVRGQDFTHVEDWVDLDGAIKEMSKLGEELFKLNSESQDDGSVVQRLSNGSKTTKSKDAFGDIVDKEDMLEIGGTSHKKNDKVVVTPNEDGSNTIHFEDLKNDEPRNEKSDEHAPKKDSLEAIPQTVQSPEAVEEYRKQSAGNADSDEHIEEPNVPDDETNQSVDVAPDPEETELSDVPVSEDADERISELAITHVPAVPDLPIPEIKYDDELVADFPEIVGIQNTTEAHAQLIKAKYQEQLDRRYDAMVSWADSRLSSALKSERDRIYQLTVIGGQNKFSKELEEHKKHYENQQKTIGDEVQHQANIWQTDFNEEKQRVGELAKQEAEAKYEKENRPGLEKKIAEYQNKKANQIDDEWYDAQEDVTNRAYERRDQLLTNVVTTTADKVFDEDFNKAISEYVDGTDALVKEYQKEIEEYQDQAHHKLLEEIALYKASGEKLRAEAEKIAAENIQAAKKAETRAEQQKAKIEDLQTDLDESTARYKSLEIQRKEQERIAEESRKQQESMTDLMKNQVEGSQELVSSMISQMKEMASAQMNMNSLGVRQPVVQGESETGELKQKFDELKQQLVEQREESQAENAKRIKRQKFGVGMVILLALTGAGGYYAGQMGSNRQVTKQAISTSAVQESAIQENKSGSSQNKQTVRTESADNVDSQNKHDNDDQADEVQSHKQEKTSSQASVDSKDGVYRIQGVDRFTPGQALNIWRNGKVNVGAVTHVNDDGSAVAIVDGNYITVHPGQN